MPQRIFWIFRILGLVVGAALLALWIRGRFVYDVAIFTTPRHVYCEICVIADQIRFTTVSRWPGEVPLHWRHDRTAYAGFAIGQRAVYRNWFPFGISMTSGGTFAVSEPFAPAINRPKPLRVRYQLIASTHSAVGLTGGAAGGRIDADFELEKKTVNSPAGIGTLPDVRIRSTWPERPLPGMRDNAGGRCHADAVVHSCASRDLKKFNDFRSLGEPAGPRADRSVPRAEAARLSRRADTFAI